MKNISAYFSVRLECTHVCMGVYEGLRYPLIFNEPKSQITRHYSSSDLRKLINRKLNLFRCGSTNLFSLKKIDTQFRFELSPTRHDCNPSQISSS